MKNKTLRYKLLSLVLVGTMMATSLTGCGKKNELSEVKGIPTPVAVEEVVRKTPSVNNGSKTEISVPEELAVETEKEINQHSQLVTVGEQAEKQDSKDALIQLIDKNKGEDKADSVGIRTEIQSGSVAEPGYENVLISDNTILVKMKPGFDGMLTKSLQDAGVGLLEEMFGTDTGVWYTATLYKDAEIAETLSKVKNCNGVVMAEYDFAYQAMSYGYEEVLAENPDASKQSVLTQSATISAWKYMEDHGFSAGGDSSVVVAVIDTGVDYEHVDLKANMWKNTFEIPDNGIDDDGNGYIDDYYGVDMVAGMGSGNDDHGHGTHVAGIIGAVNNKEGIVGIAYNSKIMAIKAGDASGVFLQSNIARAIIYAYDNGADVINMSFGGQACSVAVQDALTMAYRRCVLVAAAGNEAFYNEGEGARPCYPAALDYVIGVMSVNEENVESRFTNYDEYLQTKVEYEIYAPGENILSTLPGNKYAKLSGTSMAAPVVAAQAALLRSVYYDRTIYPTKYIYGQIVGTADQEVQCIHGNHNVPNAINVEASLSKLPQPDISVADYRIFDNKEYVADTTGITAGKLGPNNGNGTVDSGEVIALGFTLKNRWGMSKDTIVKVEAVSELGVKNPYVTILNNNVNYGSVGTYSEGDAGKIYDGEVWTDWQAPIYIQIDKNCPNDTYVRLAVTVSYKNGLDEKDTKTYVKEDEMYFSVRRGTVLPSIINEDTTLTSDNYYILEKSLTVMAGATLTLEPGTQIQFWGGDSQSAYGEKQIVMLRVEGTMLSKGTTEAPVEMFPSDLYSRYEVNITKVNRGYIALENTIVTNPYLMIDDAINCEFRQNYEGGLLTHELVNGSVQTGAVYQPKMIIRKADACAFYKLSEYVLEGGEYDGCIFVDSAIRHEADTYHNCVFYGNNTQWGVAEPQVSELTVPNNHSYAEQPSIALVKNLYDEETGKTYLFCRLLNTVVSGTMQMLPYEKMANMLGGNLLSLDSYEEFRMITGELGEETLWLGTTLKGEKAFNYDGTALPEGIPYNTSFGGYYGFYYHDHNNSVETDAIRFAYNTSGTLPIIVIEVPGDILVTDIVLDKYLVNLDMTGSHQIHAELTPSTLDSSNLVYTSDNEAVAKVSASGLITPVGAGTTTIKVWAKDKALYNAVTVNVRDKVKLTGLVTYSEVVINPGDTEWIPLKYEPLNTTEREVTYTSSDENIAVVDDMGRICAAGLGDAVITVRGANRVSATILVKVRNKTKQIVFKSPSYATTLSTEDGNAFYPSFLPENATQTELVWESSDPTICYVNAAGMLVKLTTGTVILKATVEGTDISASTKVTVYEDYDASAVIDMRQNDYGYTYALTSAGEIWTWGGADCAVPKRLSIPEKITDFALNAYYCVYVLTETGTVIRYSSPQCAADDLYNGNAERVELPLSNITSLFEGYDNFYAVDAQGDVYVWGNNFRCRLGLSSGISVVEDTAPRMMEKGECPAVVKGLGFYDGALLLDKDGNLYSVGRDNPEPKLFDTGVVDITGSEFADSIAYVYKEDSASQYGCGNNAYMETRYPEHDGQKFTYFYNYYIENGKVFVRAGYNSNNVYGQYGLGHTEDTWAFTPMVGIQDAVAVYTFANNCYIQCADGSFYGTGLGTSYQLGNGIAENSSIPTKIMLGSLNEYKFPALSKNNLTAAGVLTEEKLQLIFADDVKAGLNYSDVRLQDANGNNLYFTKKLQGNCMEVAFKDGMVQGATYTLTIPAEGLGYIGSANEEIVVTFVYAPQTAEEEVENKLPEREEQAVVIDEQKLAERFITDADIKVLWQEILKTGINGRFYANAIINRTCNDDVTSWLRVKAFNSGSYRTISLGQNYWGTTDLDLIGKQILDFEDFQTLADINEGEILTEMPSSVWPMVTDAYLLIDNERVDTVGNQEVTFVVEFNRSMDTGIDLEVAFGSNYPYRDYTVSGAYVNDRLWAGAVTLNTLIESGYEYFSITNGKAAETSQKLYTDWGRFQFVIDKSSAQSLSLFANAVENGIELNWFQDDFETLAGYNVYRATEEDGFYTRINRTVISADTTTFLDTTVEPGVMYYYNFTVVQTDLTESEPSGKTNIRAKDTMAPDIYHSPVYNAFTGKNLMITAVVTDNVGISSAIVYYRAVGESAWKSAEMTNNNDKYSAVIAAQEVTTAGLEYYIAVFDGESYSYKASAEDPYVVTVQVAIDDNAKGDVDGNGAIELKDAMMLLQAINDRINLDAAQFARADLDGNGILEAKEALRIIKYVNGSITSVLY